MRKTLVPLRAAILPSGDGTSAYGGRNFTTTGDVSRTVMFMTLMGLQ